MVCEAFFLVGPPLACVTGCRLMSLSLSLSFFNGSRRFGSRELPGSGRSGRPCFLHTGFGCHLGDLGAWIKTYIAGVMYEEKKTDRVGGVGTT